MKENSVHSDQQNLNDTISGQWFYSVGLDFKNKVFLTVNPDNPHIGVSPDFIEPLAKNNVTKYLNRGQVKLNTDGSGIETFTIEINQSLHPDVIEHYDLDPKSELTIETTNSTSFTWETGETQGYKTLIYNIKNHNTKTTKILINGKDAKETLLSAPLKDITFEFRQQMVQTIMEELSQRFVPEPSNADEELMMLKYIRDAQDDSFVVDTGVIIYEMTREDTPLKH